MNTFSNIFKKSFLKGFDSGNVTTTMILVTLAVTCVLALYIFVVYYVATKKTFYSRTFNIALALIAVITASIILAMQSNVVISLGMVGALSIVRFRTAIKDPMDLIFLFWSISVGIICGAQMFQIAIITSLVITIGLFLLELTPAGKAAVILIVNATEPDTEKAVLEKVKARSKVARVKSRNITNAGLDLIIECKPDEEATLLKEVSSIKEVVGATLMAHDGEISL
jgi:hypothetical protein